MNNRTKTDILVYDECRYPYILQTEQGYRAFRFIWYVAIVVGYSYTFFCYYKSRNLPRLTVRPLSIIVMIYFLFMLDATTVHLNEALSGSINFLNSCVMQSFSLFFVSYGLLVVMGLSLFIYFMKYKLYKTVLKNKLQSTVGSSSKTSFATDTRKEALQIHYFTTENFALKACLSLSLLGIIIFSYTTVLFCPELNPDHFECPNESEQSPDFYVYIGIGIMLLTLLGLVVFATFKYPDPFGIIREVLLVSIVYFVQVVAFNVSSALLPQFSTGHTYKITPYFFISFFGIFLFTIVAPLQLYLAKNSGLVEMSLKEIIKNPSLVKLFQIQLESQMIPELLNFHLAVAKYQNSFSTAKNNNVVANYIFERFVKSGSREELNISYLLREAISNKFRIGDEIIEIDIFHDINEEVLNMIYTKSYVCFINGPLYRLYLGLQPTDTTSFMANSSYTFI